MAKSYGKPSKNVINYRRSKQLAISEQMQNVSRARKNSKLVAEGMAEGRLKRRDKRKIDHDRHDVEKRNWKDEPKYKFTIEGINRAVQVEPEEAVRKTHR